MKKNKTNAYIEALKEIRDQDISHLETLARYLREANKPNDKLFWIKEISRWKRTFLKESTEEVETHQQQLDALKKDSKIRDYINALGQE